jgi:hypothetical protein
MRENWVIALRGVVSATESASGQDVPYFLMPDLGGSHTLRGYPAWRFRAWSKTRLMGQTPYRPPHASPSWRSRPATPRGCSGSLNFDRHKVMHSIKSFEQKLLTEKLPAFYAVERAV